MIHLSYQQAVALEFLPDDGSWVLCPRVWRDGMDNLILLYPDLVERSSLPPTFHNSPLRWQYRLTEKGIEEKRAQHDKSIALQAGTADSSECGDRGHL